MAKVTQADKGKHGTVKIGESTLVGTIAYVFGNICAGGFQFKLDGGSYIDVYAGSDADFTPDPPNLPTEPGAGGF